MKTFLQSPKAKPQVDEIEKLWAGIKSIWTLNLDFLALKGVNNSFLIYSFL